MVEYLFWAGAGVLLGLILAGDYILTRFRHTEKSRRTLALEGVGSLVFVAAVVLVGFRVAFGWMALLWVLGVAIPVFLCVAVGTVEVWRRRKLAAYDGIIRQLRRDLQKRRDDLDRLIWQSRDLERRTRASAQPAAGAGPQPLSRDGEVARLRHEIEAWQGAGGLARIRALKVEEWRVEVQGTGGVALAARRRELETALRDAADERRDALRVQIALIRLQEMETDREEKPAAATASTSAPADVGLEAVRRRRGDEEREVARLQAELDQWQRERAAFLRQRIPLD